MNNVNGKKFNSPNKCNSNGIKTIANASKIKLLKKYVNTFAKRPQNSWSIRFLRIPNPDNNNPSNTGKLSSAANNASGTVNKFNPGINAVKIPLMINGNSNSPGSNNAKFINVKNGSPPSNALSSPTVNPANAAGIKLINASSNSLNGIPNNLNNPCVNNVPSNANAGAKIQLSGLNGPNKNKLIGNDNKNNSCGNNKFLIKSLKIFNGNRRSLNKLKPNKNNGTKNNKSIAKLKNGIKLGRPNKIAANNGLINPSKALNNKIGRFNSVKKTANDVPNARSNPRPLINSGATTKTLNNFNKNNGNVINP